MRWLRHNLQLEESSTENSRSPVSEIPSKLAAITI